MKTPFSFPLLAADLENFTHPAPQSPLSSLHILDGTVIAANGYIAIQALRGRWLDTDFTPAPYEARERLSNLPWHAFPPDSPDWRLLADIRGDIYRNAPITIWKENHTLSPTPVWKVGAHQLIRLSFLQLIARLPKCEVYTGETTQSQPMFFRFNTGLLLVPVDKLLTISSRTIFPPTYHPLDGHRVTRSTRPPPSFVPAPPPEPPLDNWPPADPDDN
jgi:hypothetical protein